MILRKEPTIEDRKGTFRKHFSSSFFAGLERQIEMLFKAVENESAIEMFGRLSR